MKHFYYNYPRIWILAVILLFNLNKLCIGVKPSENLDDYNVITNITSGYQKSVRPSATLDVTIKLSLKTVSSIDEKNLVMTSDSFFTGI